MKEVEDQLGDFQKDDSALWTLLGKAPAPQMSPYFSRRVMRETARLEEEGGPVAHWLRRLAGGLRLPLAAWSGALAAVTISAIGLAVAFHGESRHSSSRIASAHVEVRDDISPSDVEVIANLDNLMAYEENRIWTDDSNAD